MEDEAGWPAPEFYARTTTQPSPIRFISDAGVFRPWRSCGHVDWPVLAGNCKISFWGVPGSRAPDTELQGIELLFYGLRPKFYSVLVRVGGYAFELVLMYDWL